MSANQGKLAVESRAYPLFRYDPDAGPLPHDCFELDGNPEPDKDWPTYTIRYREGEREKTLELPMTFADFAVTEIRFRKHFRVAPADTWNESMVPLAEFLDLPADEREGRYPYIWSLDRKQQLTRLLVAQPLVQSCEERRDFWQMLRSLARQDLKQPERTEIEAEVRQEMIQRITASVMNLAQAADGGPLSEPLAAAMVPPPIGDTETKEPAPANDQYMSPWIETDLCTSCDECIKLNPNIFEYNEDKKAVIKNPTAGPYRDLVKAAELCTARVIHPGLPKDRKEKDIDKWIARAEKYN